MAYIGSASTDAHVLDKNNPHEVTKTQVGLGNADNTSDANKPVSTATQSALDLKADSSALSSHTGDATIHFTQASISITESQISDLQSYLLDITGESLGDLGNVVLTTPTTGQILQLNGSGNWVNVDSTTVGVTDHTALSNIGTNTHAQIDTHIADSTVHFTQASISITESQISDLGAYITGVAWGDITGTLSSQTDLNSALAGKSDTTHNHDASYSALGHNHDSDYVSIVGTPTAGNFPILTVGGELDNSVYGPSDFAAAGHNHDASYSALGHSHSHTSLTDIGTNTHAQIDTHIGDSTIHFTQASISITESQISDLGSYITGVAWGDITGTLSSQTDLNSALAGKSDTSHVHEGTTIDATGITDGYVLTADGAGNAGWEAPTGGGSSPLTTKGDLYTYSTADARLPIGSDGQYLKADSTQATGLVWATVSGGSGASFPVGTIIEGPSAPTGDGTWLACDGSAVSQSTYSSLYSAIGQRHYAFDVTYGETNMGTNTLFGVWAGDQWLFTQTNSGVTYQSTDAVTWSYGGTAQNASQVNLICNGTVCLQYKMNTTRAIYRSTDSGDSWSNVSSIPTNTYPWDLVHNGGSNWIALTYGTTSIFNSTDNGASFSAGGTFPVTLYNDFQPLWDGTNWYVFIGRSDTYYYTSSSTGTSGWTSATFGTGIDWSGFSSKKFAASDGAGTIVLGGGDYFLVSTNSGASWQIVKIPYVSQFSSQSNAVHWIMWTGEMFVAYNGIGFWVSPDGLDWGFSNPDFGFNNIQAISGSSGLYENPVANTSTGEFVQSNFRLSGSTLYNRSVLCSPRADISTQFCLPYLLNGWIKASS